MVSTARWLTPRERLANAVCGVLVGCAVVPMVIDTWAPRWFAVGWGAAYTALGLVFIGLTLRRPSPRLEQTSMTTIAILFSLQQVSSVVWSSDSAHFWAASVVTLAYLIFEVSALPFIDIAEWRIGFGIIALAIAVTASIAVHPIVGVLFPMISVTTGAGVHRLRSLKATLEHELGSVERLASQDDLTGLLNRRGLQQTLAEVTRHRSTVVMIDVDHFKQINDTHGYGVGDQVLAAVADELGRRLPAPFVLARQGGDEFVAVAMEHIGVSDRVGAPITCELETHGHRLTIDVELSAGMTYANTGADLDRVLSEAGFALRQAKRSGRMLTRFTGAIQSRFDRSLEVAALTDGDATTGSGELEPVGQVIVDADGTTRGVEMLVRWRRADGRLLRPAEFLPMAAEIGVMNTINELMLDHAVAFAARFNNRPNAPFVSVNITASHLGHPEFVQRVRDLLRSHRVEAGRLMIEITESEHVQRESGWERTAEDLRRIGVRLAIDDFGSGYSSIERLHRLPISHLKFDRTLVRSVSGPFGEIARGVVKFGEQSQIGVVAEGIETLDELLSVQAIGVSLFQGFLFGRPTRLDELERHVIADFAAANRRSYQD